ncbi:leucyl aminopeptidase [Candidatus Uhrbacteria bacterium]|jgi:leucyl aminopeptidase|nr:leucyl aminopeptidase [Candidatus Uhrbacteria bacterium]
MQIKVVRGDVEDVAGDVVIVGHLEGVDKCGGAFETLDGALKGRLVKFYEEEKMRTAQGSITVFKTHGRIECARVIVVGLGKKEDLTVDGVRQAVARAMRTAQRKKAKTVNVIAMGAGHGGLASKQVAAAIAEGAHLGLYTFDKWKKKDEENALEDIKLVQIVEKDARKISSITQGIEVGVIGAKGTMHARDLVNEPPGTMKPRDLKNDALRIADESPRVSVEIFGRAELQRMNMDAFLAVAAGSDEEPYFIHLTYKPKIKAKKSIALVGKGVTFDSGGLSLKPASSMESMKMDMGGAATVLGVFHSIVDLAPSVEVHGIIPATENMPGGNAYRPGDVIRAKNGVTIEVLNTDAEGRVILADALPYACELKPDAVIDLATLTGAVVVAIGEEMTGLMTDNDKLSEQLLASAEETGEPTWRLPLFDPYNKLIESKIADVKNIGGKWGGALTAGLFLKKFVDPEIPWVHLDIAGPAFAERPYLEYVPYGGTGVMVRTLLNWLKKQK